MTLSSINNILDRVWLFIVVSFYALLRYSGLLDSIDFILSFISDQRLRKFMNKYNGHIYMPLGFVDFNGLSDLLVLAKIFPRVNTFRYVNDFDPLEAVEVPQALYRPDDIDQQRKYMVAEAGGVLGGMFGFRAGIQVNATKISEEAFYLNIRFPGSEIRLTPWMRNRNVEIQFSVKDFTKVPDVHKVIYIESPGFKGWLGRTESFWHTIASQLDRDGYLLVSEFRKPPVPWKMFRKIGTIKTKRPKHLEYGPKRIFVYKLRISPWKRVKHFLSSWVDHKEKAGSVSAVGLSIFSPYITADTLPVAGDAKMSTETGGRDADGENNQVAGNSQKIITGLLSTRDIDLNELALDIFQAPQEFLRGADPRRRFTKDFTDWDPAMQELQFAVISLSHLRRDGITYALSLVELTKDQRVLKVWIVLEKGRLIMLDQKKHSTLPGEYVADQGMYDLLSGYTYSWYRTGEIGFDGDLQLHGLIDPVLEMPDPRINLNRLLLELADADHVKRFIAEKQITLNVQLPGEPVFVSDHDQEWDLKQVVIGELIDNAVKYSPSQTTVTVTLSRHNGRAVIAVADQGIGIPEHEKVKLGDYGFRGDLAKQFDGHRC